MPLRYWGIIASYVVIAQLSSIVGVGWLYNGTGLDKYQALAVWSVITFALTTIIALASLRPDMKEAAMRSDKAGIGSTTLWAVAGVFLALFSQMIAAYIESLFGISSASENTMNLMEIARKAPLFIFIPVLFAPILEEIIFRKIIFGSLYKRTNFFVAVIISALVFGLFHFDVTHLFVYFAMGVVFAFLYVKTKRIITPIIAHMAMNSLVVLTQFNLPEEKIREIQEQMQTILTGGLW
ncbi:CPBP family intramembrane metalloprotease [Halobacillus salinarum]|uniref:CPBP family intramembrane metalloprotease n=1 Tax=Halobacillus salinarum TaxID=2932257 RepID=A0ABY4EL83_9BACI|nr:CPBP family intramembrane glutamic endopeptidase [Halobacillus salinarum]UOQ44327.1 CPBP family intramembrane metalloprotease [Halobacillus salinarum]